MAKTIKHQGYPFVIATELRDRGYGRTGMDFLISPFNPCDWIITNPPFSLSEQFILRSIEHGKPFAFLLKSQYWHATSKLKIFEQYRPEAVLPLTWRPNFLFDQKERKSGSPLMEVYWTVWGSKPAKQTIYCPLPRPKSDKKRGDEYGLFKNYSSIPQAE
ncbi:hypothetical protein [Acetonema longum]|uniref:Uncharacterized protein n=1 Tax=Acetonema longum DSM 6540 TaxID=1009370 RepID=F7NKD0_9FIRM|nr:hypothetical protein [Acetonema longum]EGO63571.1 hypothetical protein ALO_12716 [Acetonema longum DSM 6540]